MTDTGSPVQPTVFDLSGQTGQDDNKVQTCAAWYDMQVPQWDMSDDLMAGTQAMRTKGPLYLTKFELETTQGYTSRLKATVLTNFYKDHFHTAMGLIFAEPIVVKDSDIPLDQLNDVDNRGHSVQAFAEMVAAKLLTKGMHHVFVDLPPNPGAETAEDDLNMGLRPYWVSLDAKRVFNAFYEVENNV